MRLRAMVLFWLISALPAAVLVAAQAPAALPLDPIRDSGQSVTGAFEGWYGNADGSFNLLIGYFNRNNQQILDIPIGPNNRIEPGNPDQGQPTHFLPRRQWGVFTITVPKDFANRKLTWSLTANGQTASIPLSLNPLWVVEPMKDAGIGNTPPTLKLQAEGKAFQGPPAGIAAAYTVKAQEPLTLDLWASDDGLVPPERGASRGGSGGRVAIFWSLFRGSGAVTFANARPAVDLRDGKASTTAKFSAPGEYILRAQANDGSGEGGGGFQCCWTNVLVKVTVGPATSAGR